MRRTTGTLQAFGHTVQYGILIRTVRTSNFGKEVIQCGVNFVEFRRAQPMPCRQLFRYHGTQCREFILKHFQCQSGIQFGVVNPATSYAAILIVLDQMVVGIAGKSQRAQLQGVNYRQFQQAQFRVCGRKKLQIVIDDIVAQNEIGSLHEVIQLIKGRIKSKFAFFERETFPRNVVDGPNCVNLTASYNFKINRDAVEFL